MLNQQHQADDSASTDAGDSDDRHEPPPARRRALPELWGTGEIAAAYGTSTNNVANWRRRYSRERGHRVPFPAPVYDLCCGLLWLAEDVRAWYARREAYHARRAAHHGDPVAVRREAHLSRRGGTFDA